MMSIENIDKNNFLQPKSHCIFVYMMGNLIFLDLMKNLVFYDYILILCINLKEFECFKHFRNI